MFTQISDIDRMFGAMDLLRNRMGRVFGDFDKSFVYGTGLPFKSDTPRTNLFETADHFEISTEVPGVAQNDLDIKIQGNYLEISGRRALDAPAEYKAHRNERASTNFLRSFTLPGDVDVNRVEANLKDGILYLTLPKSEAAKPRQIAIN